jgi:hypothetical protein
MEHTADLSAGLVKLTDSELKSIDGGLKAQWMDGEGEEGGGG